MGAVICMPQGSETLVRQRSARDHLATSLSQVSDDGLTHNEEALRDKIGSRWREKRMHRSIPNLGNRTGRKRPCQGGKS